MIDQALHAYKLFDACLQQAMVEEAERLANPDHDYSGLGRLLQLLQKMADNTNTTYKLLEERKQKLAGALALLYQLLPAHSVQVMKLKEVIQVSVTPGCKYFKEGLALNISRLQGHPACLCCPLGQAPKQSSGGGCPSMLSIG